MAIRNKIKTILFLGGGLALLASSTPVLAASASMYLSSAGSVTKGSYVVVSIRENSGSEPVNAAKATLSYPTSQLQFISISSSNAFSIVAANSGGGGSVNVERGALPAVSGTQTVASVTFKALSDSGTAAVGISTGQVISANSNSNILAGTSGTNIALKAPVAAPPKDTTPPTITLVKASDITFNSVVITWTTSEPATGEINYGPSTSYGIAAVDTNPVTDHKITLNSPLIEPGLTYHYTVKSVDPSGNAATSSDATFTTSGATLIVKVIDQHKNALKGATIEVDSKKATTNQAGVATLKDLSLGKKVVVVNYKGQQYPINVDIKDATTPQNVTASIKVPRSFVLPIVIVVILLVVAAYLLGRGSGHGPARSTLVGFGLMGHKLPLPRPFKKKISSFITVKDIDSNGPPPPIV